MDILSIKHAAQTISAGAWDPLRPELEARLTPPPEAGLRGWEKWSGVEGKSIQGML